MIVVMRAILVAIASLISACSGPVTEPEDVLDHFLCYAVTPTQFNAPLFSLIDQFYVSPPDPAQIIRRKLLCNPADKLFYEEREPRTRKRKHDEAHLVCYDLVQKHYTKPDRYQVLNQFDVYGLHYKWRVIQSEMLCLPSGKSGEADPPPAIPKVLDHFKCYSVTIDKDAPRYRVRVTDQWLPGTSDDWLPGREAWIEDPQLLCNPAEKVIEEEQKGPMKYNFAHLACFDVVWGPDAFMPQSAKITNQFEPAGVVLKALDVLYLCVPSRKQRI
jgi:hypothetical protein